MKKLPKKISRNVKIGKRGPLMRTTGIVSTIGPPDSVPAWKEKLHAADALLAEIATLEKNGEYLIRTQRVKQIFGVCAPLEGGQALKTAAVSPQELSAVIESAVPRKLLSGIRSATPAKKPVRKLRTV